jgi:hypothetical protein
MLRTWPVRLAAIGAEEHRLGDTQALGREFNGNTLG